jgi:hypothetical protein
MKNKYLFFSILIIGLGVIFVNTFIQSRNEYKKKFDFIITKIEITPTSTLIFYNNDEKIEFWNYTIMKDEGVIVGDKIVKDRCSEKLFIYKKINNEYVIFLIKKPDGLFPISFFCN